MLPAAFLSPMGHWAARGREERDQWQGGRTEHRGGILNYEYEKSSFIGFLCKHRIERDSARGRGCVFDCRSYPDRGR